MHKQRIEQLREIINNMICSDDCDRDQLMQNSQELDKLIFGAVKKNAYVKNVLGYELMSEFDEIIEKMHLFEKVYNTMRIVDPVKKEVLEVKKGTLCSKGFECYEFWNRQQACENCISMRAYNEDDVVIKVEYGGNKALMVAAVPISILGKKLVAELLKDITVSIYMPSKQSENQIKILSAIEHMNQAEVKDNLTGLYNRRFVEERLLMDLVKSSLRNEPLAVILAKLDCVKTINDKYGPEAGVKVLQKFEEETKANIKKGEGWAARYSAEGFLICLYNTDISNARVSANSIRQNFAEREFSVGGDEPIQLSCSFQAHVMHSEDEYLKICDIINN